MTEKKKNTHSSTTKKKTQAGSVGKKASSAKGTASKRTTKRKRNKKMKKRLKSFIRIYKVPLILTVLVLILAAILTGLIIHRNREKKVDSIEAYVDAACKEFDFPKSIVMAIIKTESDFDVFAESSSNARGLMQITKITLQDINQRINTNYAFGQMFDPEINIRCGVFYLSYLYERFGDYEIAFAAYNAGPTIVSEWLTDDRYATNGKLTNIPYPETDRYVQKVCHFWDGYKKQYG